VEIHQKLLWLEFVRQSSLAEVKNNVIAKFRPFVFGFLYRSTQRNSESALE
jgi:hypothetical protein